MYVLKQTKRFKKDLKNISKDKDVIKKLQTILDLLLKKGALPKRYYNHKLHGEFKHCFECHIKLDVLLLYEKNDKELILLLLRVGSHSDIF